jgi:hypothetical protein
MEPARSSSRRTERRVRRNCKQEFWARTANWCLRKICLCCGKAISWCSSRTSGRHQAGTVTRAEATNDIAASPQHPSSDQHSACSVDGPLQLGRVRLSAALPPLIDIVDLEPSRLTWPSSSPCRSSGSSSKRSSRRRRLPSVRRRSPASPARRRRLTRERPRRRTPAHCHWAT